MKEDSEVKNLTEDMINKQIYEAPEPWESETLRSQQFLKNVNSFISILIVITLIFISILLYFNDATLIKKLFLFGLSIGILVPALYSFPLFHKYIINKRIEKQKDNWILELNINKDLFNKITNELGDFLKQHDFKITHQSEYHEIGTHIKPKKDRTRNKIEYFGQHIHISLQNKPNLIIEFQFKPVDDLFHNRSGFMLSIRNISMENLSFAQQLQKNVHNYLESIHYKEYPVALTIKELMD